MNLHRPLVGELKPALEEIFFQGFHADKVIERHLKSHRQWGSRDRRFFAETVYEVVRWRRRLKWAYSGIADFLGEDKNFEDVGPMVSAHMLIKGLDELPDWMAPVRASKSELLQRWQHCPSRAVRESIPDWLDELGYSELGEGWNKLLPAMNQQAPVFLRANTLRVSADDLRQRLAEEGVDTERVSELRDGLRLVKRTNVFQTEAFRRGEFEMQDGGSQQIAPLLEVQPGERVVDACAGAGGKTLHLAALLQNAGKIIALDIHARKLEELMKRVRRARVDIVESRLIDSTKVIKRLKGSADRVLLDVPCSGLGVLRRNPDQKWKLTIEEVLRLQDLQRDILRRYSEMVKPGGRLVYATCSVLRSENELQVQEFVDTSRGEWAIEQQIWVDPSQTPVDGFYAARLVRKTSAN